MSRGRLEAASGLLRCGREHRGGHPEAGAGLLAGVAGADGLALGEWIFTRVTVSGSSSTPSLCAASASIL